MVKVSRFEVFWVNLDPTVGIEIQKTRPCVIISPDEMNHSHLGTLIIAPLTSTIRNHYPTRIEVNFAGRQANVVLDQMRAVDRARIGKKMGSLKLNEGEAILKVLQELFS